ncbi:hypothetical protein [Paracoccus sp. S3-43]|uniref:hypothetical protein n=1 Tax=Paracoccus sp. S3-43 TaxID=3030011 RepID=UPI0023B17BEA|nr:hypothetical protein [Paracoccus sp. S3-43]WEF24853.1 hypothetical protein PXD02_02545 [Paracoccus sp. S3-43]
MRIHCLIVPAVALTLMAGCAPSRPPVAMDYPSATCHAFGFPEGTADFARCVAETRQADLRSAEQASMALFVIGQRMQQGLSIE